MKILFYGVIALALIGFGTVAVRSVWPSGNQGVCTAEALMCPDGSGVGRTGLQCQFAACPDRGPITGELSKDASGYRMILQAPEGGIEVTYAMPLVVDAAVAEPLLGQRVTTMGTFVEGNTLLVESIAPAVEGSDVHEAILGVGETKLVSGVAITLKAVTADSRCPVDVQCIQAGWVTVQVALKSDTDAETLELRSGDTPHPFDAFKISVLSATPEPRQGVAIDPQSYHVLFRVDPLE